MKAQAGFILSISSVLKTLSAKNNQSDGPLDCKMLFSNYTSQCFDDWEQISNSLSIRKIQGVNFWSHIVSYIV